MKKQIALFIFSLSIIGAAACFLGHLRTHQKLGAPGVRVSPVSLFDESGKIVAFQSVTLPEHISNFVSRPISISASELTTLPKDTVFGRRGYQGDNGFVAMSSVVLMGADRTSIHKPEFCLPGQGWTILNQERIDIKMERPFSYYLPAMKWTIAQRTKDAAGQMKELRGVYIFWFVSDKEITPFHGSRITSMVKRMISKGELERWAYVTFFSPCTPGTEDSAFEGLRRLITACVPEFQVTTGLAQSPSR